MTKAEMARVARQARRYGHFDTGLVLWLRCPTCGERVEVDRQPPSRVTIVRQLDAMMIHHLEVYCGQD